MESFIITDCEAAYGLLKKAQSVFFIGIGGISMSGLAAMTCSLGRRVGGSDRTASWTTEKLKELGIEIFIGHDASNIKNYDIAVATAAVHSGNPELEYASEKGIPCLTRAAYLGALMKPYKTRIGVSGTHGKSTTTAMISGIYADAGLDPTVSCGAVIDRFGGAYRVGKGNDFIFEACEYTDSFLSFCPTDAVVTNIEYDHADYFKDMDQLRDSFLKYISLAETAYLNTDNENVRMTAERFRGRIVSYGMSGTPDYGADNITLDAHGAGFTLTNRGKPLCEIMLRVTGRHNVCDAVAAAAVCIENGIAPETVAASLGHFRSAERRFEFMGTYKGAELYEDYAHHPTEIRAALECASLSGKKVICVFQPHTYTRTKALFGDFADALSGADEVLLTDIYAAREDDIYGVSSKQLAASVKNGMYTGDLKSTAEYLKGRCKPGELVLITGAGDVNRITKMLLCENAENDTRRL